MTRYGTSLIVVLALGFGLGAFFVSHRATPICSCHGGNGCAAPAKGTDVQTEVFEAKDPKFSREFDSLRREYRQESLKLLALFEAVDASDSDLSRQSRSVMAVHDLCQKRIVRHLLRIRSDLSSGQRARFACFLAGYVRGSDQAPCRGRRCRWGQRARAPTCGCAYGDQCDCRNPDCRVCREKFLCCRMRLTEEQFQTILKVDSEFGRKNEELVRDFDRQRRALAGLFENPSATDEQIESQLDQMLRSHDRLEEQVSDHILAVRRHLNPDQRKILMNYCGQNIRQGWGCSMPQPGQGCRDCQNDMDL